MMILLVSSDADTLTLQGFVMWTLRERCELLEFLRPIYFITAVLNKTFTVPPHSAQIVLGSDLTVTAVDTNSL